MKRFLKKLKAVFFQSAEARKEPLPPETRVINFILVAFLVAAALILAFSNLSYDFHWDSVWVYREKFFSGLLLTLALSFFALFFSLILGFLFGLGQRSVFLPLRFFSRFYVELIRGTPLLVQILVFFYVVASALGLENRFVLGIAILSMFSGAYSAEVVRAGIESIGETQWETSRSLGFSTYQTYRYVIFPQVMKRILPNLAGQLVSLIKDSSLLSIIAVSELTLNAQEINAYTYSTLESYLPLALGYLLLTYPVSLISKKLEKKFSYAD